MKLKKYLSVNAISQAEFSRIIGESPQNLSRYVNGRIPEKDVMRKIVSATSGEVTANDFYDLNVLDHGAASSGEKGTKSGKAVHWNV